MEYLVPSITFLIGLIAAFTFQYFQSKEVLKQTLYKEKISAYKTTAVALSDVYMTIIQFSHSPDQYRNDLSNQVLGFLQTLILNFYLLPKDFFDLSSKLLETLVDLDNLNINESFNTIASIIDYVRDDMGVDKLSGEITDLYSKFPAISLMKSKN